MISEILTLGFTNDSLAKELLVLATKIVEPIIIKRKYTINKLEEFYPRDKYLLGLNNI